jgi:hypothetical protein
MDDRRVRVLSDFFCVRLKEHWKDRMPYWFRLMRQYRINIYQVATKNKPRDILLLPKPLSFVLCFHHKGVM